MSVASLVEFEEKGTAEALPRYNRQRAVTISAALSEDYTLTEAVKYLEEVMIKSCSPKSDYLERKIRRIKRNNK